jgi:serine/threonine-protein kinase HipA
MGISKLEVSLDFGREQRVLGRLAVTSTHYAFEFDSEFLDKPLPVSPFVLPPIKRVIMRRRDERLWGVFEDSLPDSFGRKALARRMRSLGIDEASELDRLAVLGTRAMGALIYQPEAGESGVVAKPIELSALAQESELLYQESTEKVLDALVAAAGTAGGARPKAVVGRTPDGRMWPDNGSLPDGASLWIVKFHGDDSIHSGIIEGLLNELAGKAGIRVPRSEILRAADGREYFAAERFDRTRTERWHMHTMGGLTSRSDFEPPEYAELLGIAQQLTRSMRGVEECLRRMIFNVAVGNRDDHDRNFAFLMNAGGEWDVSPAYDITWVDPRRKPEHVMLVAGKGKGITRDDCWRLAQTAGVTRKNFNAIHDEVVDVVKTFEAIALDRLPPGLVGEMVKAINQNLDLLQ